MFRRLIKLIFFLVFIISFYIFIVSNQALLESKLSFRFTILNWLDLESIPLPTGYILLGTFCLGIFFAFLMGIWAVSRQDRELRSRKRLIEELEKELNDLRALYAIERRQQWERRPVAFPVPDFERGPADRKNESEK